MLLSGAPQGSEGLKVGGVDHCQETEKFTQAHTYRDLDTYTCSGNTFMSGIGMQTDNSVTIIYHNRPAS